MNSRMDRRGFLKAMLVLAGSVVAPSLISIGPRESIYIPKIKQASTFVTSTSYTDIPRYHNKKIHVAMSGDDILGNGTFVNPYKTLKKGISEVESGGILHIMPGTYQTTLEW